MKPDAGHEDMDQDPAPPAAARQPVEFRVPAAIPPRPAPVTNPQQLAHINKLKQDTLAQTQQFMQQFDSLHVSTDSHILQTVLIRKEWSTFE